MEDSGTDPQGGWEYHGISLVGVMWKVVTVILNQQFTNCFAFQDVLHGFHKFCGTGTASLEAKLIHKLTATREEVLYMLFLHPQNAYAALDRY